jgi:hypothetical protein
MSEPEDKEKKYDEKGVAEEDGLRNILNSDDEEEGEENKEEEEEPEEEEKKTEDKKDKEKSKCYKNCYLDEEERMKSR